MIGRPRKNKDELLRKRITICITKTEKKRIEKIVKIKQTSLNQFIRDLFNENLEKIEEELDIL